jgi:hypothetical protein
MVDKLIERYFRLENPSGYPVEILSNSLNMSFSEEFVRISSICRFDYLGRGTEWFSAQQLSDRSVVGETLNLRKNFGLPKEYLFLADDGTSCMYLMSCCGDHEEVYWDSCGRGYRSIYVLKRTSFEYNPTILSTKPFLSSLNFY